MLYIISPKDVDAIEEIVMHFTKVFPDIPFNEMYERIYNGYCMGEGKSLPIITMDDWETVLYNREGRELFSECADWTDYENANKENWCKGVWCRTKFWGGFAGGPPSFSVYEKCRRYYWKCYILIKEKIMRILKIY